MEINDNIKKQLGNWWPLMEPLITQKDGPWDNLFKMLKYQSKELKKTIMPASSEVFKSWELCNKDRIKALVILQCPYATVRQDVVIADGIPMNCKNIAPYQQPSLFLWHSAIEDQYGFDPNIDQRCDISYLLEEENIMLVNASSTVEKDKPDSHWNEWYPIMSWFLENVINKYMTGLPIVLVGTSAQKLEKHINPLLHHILKIEHPAAAAYSNRTWKHQSMHKWINNIIEQNNGKQHCVRWTRNQKEVPDKDNAVLQDWLKGSKIDEDQVIGPLPWNKKE